MVKSLRNSENRGLRRSIAGGLGVYDDYRGASLDLNFAKYKRLDNRVTFTRASIGTYVDVDGIIRTSTENLLAYSEEFDQAAWIKSPTVSFSANVATDPNNLFTVEKPNKTWTFWGFYDQSNSAWISTYPKAFPFTVTNEWVRQSVQITAPTGCTILRFYPGRVGSAGDYFYQTATVVPGQTYTASAYYKLDTDGTVLVWGAQLEKSSTVGEYVKTTITKSGAPRFDHDPATGESLGLLIEEARTNLIQDSESFSSWTVQGSTQTTAASITAPDGTAGGVQEFTESSVSEAHRIFTSKVTGSIPCTHSIFVKRGSGLRYPYFSSDNTSGARKSIAFNLDTGIVTGDTVDFSNTFVIQYPNGWYRIGATITDDGVGNALHIWGFAEDTNSGFSLPYLGDGTSSFYFWGAQMEVVTVSSVGAEFVSSYIPTSGGSATRSADVAEITGANFSSFYNQSEGSVFAEWQASYANQFSTVFQFNAGAASTNLLEAYRNNSDTSVVARIRESDGTQNTVANSISSWTGQSNKIAISYESNFLGASVNSSSVNSDTSLNLPTPNALNLGATTDGAVNKFLSGHVKRIAYFNTRLPDATLQTISI